MDVHVHQRHRHRHRQHTAGKFAFHDLVAVSFFQGGGQELGLDEPSVDKKHLHGPGPPPLEGPGDKARDGHAVSASLDGEKAPGEVPAQGRVNRGVQPPVAGGVEGVRAVLAELKGYAWMGQRQMLHQAVYRGGFRAVLLHEF